MVVHQLTRKCRFFAQDQSCDLGDRPGLSEKNMKEMALQVEQEHAFLHVDRHI